MERRQRTVARSTDPAGLSGTAKAGRQLSKPRAAGPHATAHRPGSRGLLAAGGAGPSELGKPVALLRTSGALDAPHPAGLGTQGAGRQARRGTPDTAARRRVAPLTALA